MPARRVPASTPPTNVNVRRVSFQKLAALDGGDGCSLGAAVIRGQVEAARAVRFGAVGKPQMLVNGDRGPASPLASSGA